MVTDKKPTKPISKTPKKSKSKKQSNKKLKIVKSGKSSKGIPSLSSPSDSDVNPPDGFRVVSITQALMEYAVPLMEKAPAPEDIVKVNEVMTLGTALWNCAIYEESTTKDEQAEKSKVMLLSLMQDILGLDQEKARDFFAMMIERKQYLFPREIQPKGSPIRFMRKEAH